MRVADPKACQCGEVLKGVLKPWECKVFGTACTPETPDRHLHGLARGRLRGLLQLRPLHPRAGQGGDHGRDLASPSRYRGAEPRGAGARAHRARRAPRKAKLSEERITLAHGAGGKATQTLIEAVFLEAFRNPLLAPLEDGAVLTALGGRAGLHHRLLRGVAAVLPRRRHRRPGRQRHRQRPGRVRGQAAVAVGRVHPRGGVPGRRPGADRRLDGRRRRAGRGPDRHRRHQGGAAGQGRRLLHQHRRGRRDRAPRRAGRGHGPARRRR